MAFVSFFPTMFLVPSTITSVKTRLPVAPTSAVNIQLVLGLPINSIGNISAPLIFSRSSGVQSFPLVSSEILLTSSSTPSPGAFPGARGVRSLPVNAGLNGVVAARDAKKAATTPKRLTSLLRWRIFEARDCTAYVERTERMGYIKRRKVDE